MTEIAEDHDKLQEVEDSSPKGLYSVDDPHF